MYRLDKSKWKVHKNDECAFCVEHRPVEFADYDGDYYCFHCALRSMKALEESLAEGMKVLKKYIEEHPELGLEI